MVKIGVELLDQGINYIRIGLDLIRDFLIKIAGWLPLDSNLAITILFLLVSLWGGHFIVKRFVVRPFQFSYLPWVLIISISIFLNLMYL